MTCRRLGVQNKNPRPRCHVLYLYWDGTTPNVVWFLVQVIDIQHNFATLPLCHDHSLHYPKTSIYSDFHPDPDETLRDSKSTSQIREGFLTSLGLHTIRLKLL